MVTSVSERRIGTIVLRLRIEHNQQRGRVKKRAYECIEHHVLAPYGATRLEEEEGFERRLQRTSCANGSKHSGISFRTPIASATKGTAWFVASFRRKAIAHWPPAVCLSLWLLQWPFAIVSAAGCMGGGCGDPVRSWLEFIGTLAYNLGPAYWLWRRSSVRVPQ
jgi:hypothetical protein